MSELRQMSSCGECRTVRDGTEQNASLLDQAESLKITLSEALSQTRDLLAALKRQKKQTRLVRSTLQSLRELQSLDA